MPPYPALDAFSLSVYGVVLLAMALLTVRRPSFGVAGLTAIDPFALYRMAGHTTITLPKTALIGLIVGLLARRDFPLRLLAPLESKARPLTIGALLIVLATALTLPQAEHRVEVFRETLKALEYLAAFFFIVVAMREDPDEDVVRITLAAILGIVSLCALAQLVTGAPSGLYYHDHVIPRIAGPIEGPNQLSAYLGIVLPLVAAFALLRVPSRLELLALILGTITLVLTLSRTGVFASLLALALTVALAPSARKRFFALLLGGGLCIGVGMLELLSALISHDPGLLSRFSSTAESVNAGEVGTRSVLWRAAIALWRTHPLFGIGAGNFELEIGKVGPQHIKTHANSLYLQSLAEGGIPLLGAQLYTVAASIASFMHEYRRSPFVLGALAASVGLALHQTFDLLVFYPKVGEMWWIALALGVSACRTPSGGHVSSGGDVLP